MSCIPNNQIYTQNSHIVDYSGCGGCGSCSNCAQSIPNRVVYEPPVIQACPPRPQASVAPCYDSFVVRNPLVNSVSIADGNGGFYETSPTKSGQILKAFKIDSTGADRAANLELDFAAIEASDIDPTTWANLPNGIIPASKISGSVVGPTTGVTGISVNAGPVNYPINGIVNLNVATTGGGNGTVTPTNIVGLTGAGTNKYVGTDSVGNPGIYSLPTTAGGAGITTITSGFGMNAVTSGGVTNISVKASDWVPATANAGAALSTTELLGKDGKSYKVIDSGEIVSIKYFGNGGQTQWTCPEGVTRISFTLIGAGAGGSAAAYQDSKIQELVGSIILDSGLPAIRLDGVRAVIPGQTYTIQLGTAGIGASKANLLNDVRAGTAGTDSKAFGYTAKGGQPSEVITNGQLPSGTILKSLRANSQGADTNYFPALVGSNDGTPTQGNLVVNQIESFGSRSILTNDLFISKSYSPLSKRVIEYIATRNTLSQNGTYGRFSYQSNQFNDGNEAGLTAPTELEIIQGSNLSSSSKCKDGATGYFEITYQKGKYGLTQ